VLFSFLTVSLLCHQYIAGQVWRSHEGCDFIQTVFNWDHGTYEAGGCRGGDWDHQYMAKFLNKKKYVAFAEGKADDACYEVPKEQLSEEGGCPDRGEDGEWVQHANEASGNNGCCIPLSRVKCLLYIHGFKKEKHYKLMSDWMNRPDTINQQGGPVLKP
jgi:hypothetical protein